MIGQGVRHAKLAKILVGDMSHEFEMSIYQKNIYPSITKIFRREKEKYWSKENLLRVERRVFVVPCKDKGGRTTPMCFGYLIKILPLN